MRLEKEKSSTTKGRKVHEGKPDAGKTGLRQAQSCTKEGPALNVGEEGHKAEVHVELLVAVEEREAGIVCLEIDFDFLIAVHHDYIFEYARGGLRGVAREFEGVAMEMDGVNVVTGVAHADAVTLAFFQVKGWLAHHLISRISDAVDGPLIESVEGGVLFFEQHGECLVGLGGVCGGIAEVRVIPFERSGRKPLRLGLAAGIFDDDAHAVTAIVVVEVSHDPDSGMVHLDDGGNSLGGSEPENRNANRFGERIAIHGNHGESVTGQGEAANFGGASVQHMEKDALALPHAHGLAMSQHAAVDGEGIVADLESVRSALGERGFHLALAGILQFGDWLRGREEVLGRVAAVA